MKNLQTQTMCAGEGLAYVRPSVCLSVYRSVSSLSALTKNARVYLIYIHLLFRKPFKSKSESESSRKVANMEVALRYIDSRPLFKFRTSNRLDVAPVNV